MSPTVEVREESAPVLAPRVPSAAERRATAVEDALDFGLDAYSLQGGVR